MCARVDDELRNLSSLYGNYSECYHLKYVRKYCLPYCSETLVDAVQIDKVIVVKETSDNQIFSESTTGTYFNRKIVQFKHKAFVNCSCGYASSCDHASLIISFDPSYSKN